MTMELLIEIFGRPPNSMFFIALLAFAVSLATSLSNRFLTNREQLKAWNKEIREWRAESMKATRSGDKKLMAKVKKQERHVMQLQSKMTLQSMKTSVLWFIPLMLMWYVLLPQIVPIGEIVAYLPWISGEFPLNVFLWYLLCSFLAGALFTRLLGLSLGGD
jgi:uncharacterized membrane protein (DUF106 family)